MERIVIVIAGPTCSGKTKVGIDLASKLGSEIISADSRQIYKLLSIGTAKPNDDELNKIKHHFVDILEPGAEYNVSRFEVDALNVIQKLFDENKNPVVVGGSGLYIRALIDGIFNSVDVNEEYREELKYKREKFGNEFIYEELKKIDPASAEKMLPQNWKRVMRALEVFYITGKPISKFHEEYKRENKFNFVQFGLNWDRHTLYKNIEARVDQMISAGLIDEVKSILSKGYSKEINALNTVGYKEIISFLENEISLERAIELIKRNTRRYAKRQLTWFRGDERIKWIDVSSENELNKISDLIINSLHLV
jgi:tRNA dimethylallyltransferase